MKIARVILDIQSNNFSKPLNYAVCDKLDESSVITYLRSQLCKQIEFDNIDKYQIQVGSSVVVPFGKQFKIGFVVDIFEDDSSLSIINRGRIKPVLFAVTNKIFTEENVAFAKFISEKYICSLATCLRLFIPAGSNAKLTHSNNIWKVSSHNFRDSKSNLIENYLSSSFQEKKDWKNFVLTNSQNTAISQIEKSIENLKSDVFLLNGVTGSGKTEVYLRAIEKVIEKGKNAIVLIPEISLTPQTVSRFYARFKDNIAVLHSKITASQRYNQFKRIMDGQVNVVIGARSALFCPLANIGLIVIDEEHENTYKQDKNPRYNTRDCAYFLAVQNNAVLVLGSATPSLESIYMCREYDNWHEIKLLERTNKHEMPKIEVVDMGMEFKGGCKNLFSRKLEIEICNELKAGHKVVLFHNRRGFANYMFCRSCGFTPKCPNCSTTLTYHQRLILDESAKQMLLCHHCGHLEHVPITCPDCDSPYIAKYGAGTQSVEEQLQALIAENELENVTVVRMDADTTRKKFGHQKCLENFARAGAAVLLGTQMIAKGLDFDDVTLVGVILADTTLTLPDFRSSERTFDLIIQVAGRAGRSNLPGKVIVQTYTPEAKSIYCASNYMYDEFISEELAKRRLMKYPPYVDLANIIVSSIRENEAKDFSDKVFELIQSYIVDNSIDYVEVMPCSTCVLEKIRNKFRYHVLVKCSNNKNISEFLENALKTLKLKASVKLLIDIDPISLL